MQERTIIDGQQRLTTLQLLLDALHAELLAVGAEQPAMRVETLVMNARPFWERPEDRFKVWPTNRDRAAFNAVMAADPPVAYDALEHRTSRMVQAHEYFAKRAREWLAADVENVQARAGAIERTVRELMQMVVIDLAADENAQEIFETLNARGAQLTAADLIKNFIFQRLTESGVDVEAAYEQYWKEFETGFWETEISAGRVRHQRSSMFLNHWLIAKTGEEILAREVFHRFKAYADFESGVSMIELLGNSTAPAGSTGASSAPPGSSLARSTGSGCSRTAPASWKARSSSRSCCSCSTRTRPRSRTISSPRRSRSSRAGWSGGCWCGQAPSPTRRYSPN